MIGNKRIEVYYHGDLVGHLANTPNHMVAFQYADNWIYYDRYEVGRIFGL